MTLLWILLAILYVAGSTSACLRSVRATTGCSGLDSSFRSCGSSAHSSGPPGGRPEPHKHRGTALALGRSVDRRAQAAIAKEVA
jgi:hypothetical protein